MSSTLYRGGAVLAPAVLAATSLLVADGTIVWVGGDDEADGLAPAADTVVDLHGALVTPGFVDAHAHVLLTGLRREGVDLSGATDLADALARLGRASRGPEAHRLAADGAPLTGAGWDEQSWPERRAPTRTELDAACGGAPVLLDRAGGGQGVVSTSFAQVLGLPALDGWREDGLVQGTAFATARAAVLDVDPTRRGRLVGRALAELAGAGVVALHEMSAPETDSRDGLAELMAATADPVSALPLVVGYRAELCETTDDARAILAALPGLTGIGGHLGVDGSLGARTAALRAPYAELPAGSARSAGSVRPAGELALNAEQVSNHVAAVTRAGVQAGFRVSGDRAMDEVLLGFRAASDVEGVDALRRAGHRLEHVTMLDAPALATTVLLGLTCSVQPAFDAALGGESGRYAQQLGPGRAASLLPLADLLAAGIPLAFGSGTPTTPLDPWVGVQAAVRHRTPDQRVGVRAAVTAATRGGWLAAGLGADGAGELRVGAPAHLAIWAVDDGEQPTDGALPGSRPDWRAYGVQQRDAVLPSLPDDAPLPRCLRTVRAGVVLHDTLG
ncbi:MAG TPA: amidohydrolase family protein [Cellulomonas sp.]